MTSVDVREGLLENSITKGENPVYHVWNSRTVRFLRVALFGTTAPIGWYIPSEAQYLLESDSEQVP